VKLYQFAIKRTFDIVVAIFGIVLLSPCALVIMAVLKIVSPGPVFYIQDRIGRFGRPFKCVKFRTMSVGTDAHGSVTAANDRRITPLGRLLRAYKLDEFPQLWNVLIGKMSFVGPRPDVPGYADKLSGDDRCILLLRPGITGPASIFFRYEEQLLSLVNNPVSFNDESIWPVKVQINKQYGAHWGFLRDIGFILITVVPALNRVVHLLPSAPRTMQEYDAAKSDWNFQ
jgi:lipopolysaccharide/colanic/teichoic acid biosynthesis glycosyltransferase